VFSFPSCDGTGQAATSRHCLWQEIQAANEAKYPGDTTWPTPDPQFLYGQQVTVPNVSGLSIKDATSTLQKAGFTVTTGQPQASTVQPGLVAATNPAAGTEATPGSAVALLPSSGPANPNPGPTPGVNGVPNLIGLQWHDAVAQLTAMGLVGNYGYTGNKSGDCTVKAQDPPPGSPAPGDGAVKFLIRGTPQSCP
jgi:beta-lactam-binding protein with PASTA domain